MYLTVTTPEKELLKSVPVEELTVPGARGELGILTGHAPMVSPLGSGVLKYRPEKQKDFKKMALSWGFLEVRGDNHVFILAEKAAVKDRLKEELLKEELKKIVQQLNDVTLPPDEVRKLKKQKAQNEALLKLFH